MPFRGCASEPTASRWPSICYFVARRIGKPITALEAVARQAIPAYPWPGNLRELCNVIERAVIFASGRTIALSDLPVMFSRSGRANSTASPFT